MIQIAKPTIMAITIHPDVDMLRLHRLEHGPEKVGEIMRRKKVGRDAGTQKRHPALSRAIYGFPRREGSGVQSMERAWRHIVALHRRRSENVNEWPHRS
ncbi:MAG: hypothetical protein ABWZ64_03130 [Xanthobacteraceae bacterium]